MALFDDEEEDEKGNVERQRPRSPSEVLPRRRRGVSPSRSVDLAIADRSDVVVGEQSSSQSNDRRGWTFPRKTPTNDDGDGDDGDDDDGVTTPYPYPSRSSPPPSSPSADAP